MIGYLRGVLMEKNPDSLIIDVSGVGYEITLPASSFCVLPKVSEVASLYIYTHVREDMLKLFGFATLFDRKVFEMLLGVTGVGPKMAVAALGALTGIELCEVIAAGKLAALVGTPGVGQKTAERVILELREKAQKLLARKKEFLGNQDENIMPLAESQAANSISKAMKMSAESTATIIEDLEAALLNLGYKEKQINEYVKEIEKRLRNGESLSLEASLRHVLRKLSGHLVS